MAVKTYPKGSREQLSKNFRAYEFDCPCPRCKVTPISEELVKRLQAMRDILGVPITVNGYRCPEHNAEVSNSSKTSRHMQGGAADVKAEGKSPDEVAKVAETVGFKGIGLYNTAKDGRFVHVDDRENKYFWFGHGQAKRTTFGGASTDTPKAEKKATEPARALDKTLAGTYKVTASALNVRNGAGTTKKILVTIPKGTAVKCYGYYTEVSGKKWLSIQFTHKGVFYVGFSSEKYLSK